MDEEKIVDKVLNNISISKAIYEIGLTDRLSSYLKSEYTPTIEKMLRSGLDKEMIIDFLKKKQILKNTLSEIEAIYRSIRIKVNILSMIYLISLSILIPIISMLNAMAPSILFNKTPIEGIFLILLIHGVGQIILSERIFNYISLENLKIKGTIMKVIIYIILSISINLFYENILTNVLVFK